MAALYAAFPKSKDRGNPMKSSKKLALGVTLACAALGATTAMAATEAEKLAAIDNGLANLYTTQQGGGYWNYGGYEPAATGAAVLAFTSQKDKWGTNTAQYQAAVDRAVSYLLSTAATTTVGVRNDGNNPCGSGTCLGVYWPAANNEVIPNGTKILL